MDDVGLAFLAQPGVPEIVRLSQRAEQLRYHSVWMAETRSTRDAFVPVAAIAQATSDIKIGTGVVNPYTRGPVVLALSFLSLHELAEGRVIAGIGPGSPTVLAAQGISFSAPLSRLHETTTIMYRLFQDGRATHVGDQVQVHDIVLEHPVSGSSIPIMLGVTGPNALELVGRIADGVILNGFLPHQYYNDAFDTIDRTVRERKLPPSGFTLSGFVVTSVDEDAIAAYDRVRPLVATYLTTFPNIARQTGYPGVRLEQLRDVFARRGASAAGRLVDDEWVDALTLVGTLDECRTRLGRYRDWGVRLPIVAPIANFDTSLEALAPSYNAEGPEHNGGAYPWTNRDT